MTRAVRFILDRWPLAALIASAAMLAAAHAFERFGGLPPCFLCLKQREAYWWAGSLAIAGGVLTRFVDRKALRVAVDLVLAVAFLVGAGVAVYHAGAEWKFWPGPSVCAAGGSASMGGLAAIAAGEAVKAPSCEDALWVFAGLSMAGWNALISLGLAALSLAAARHEASKP
jgi:disulfide bond formation protein DsbB